MGLTGIFVLLIIAANILVSAKGFKSSDFMARYDFHTERVLIYKEYRRFITSAFLHVNWWHLIFNMIALYFFGAQLGTILGAIGFLAIYVAGVLGGNAFALYIQRNNSGYSTVGASAGINAVMMACIVLIPGMSIYLFFLPVPGWLLGLAYMLFSIYGIRSRKEGVSHEAHLGGGILGILIALLWQPSALVDNWWVVLLLLVPSLAFVLIVVRYPHYLLIGSIRPKANYTRYDRENIEKKVTEAQVDAILEKINQKGMRSLTRQEKETLHKYSKP